MDTISPGALKLIVASHDVTIAGALAAHVRHQDIRALAPNATLIYTDANNATIRDWLRPHAGDASVIVVEFERWSAHGEAIDTAWLLRRGH
jgi:hypothetical protein